MDYIKLVKLFISAERTSNWELHLYIVSQMLNLFASTGHINYAKSARLYVQEMLNPIQAGVFWGSPGLGGGGGGLFEPPYINPEWFTLWS